MENFWKWLIKANARAVFAVAVIILLLVTGWSIWRALQPVVAENMPAGNPTGERNRARLSIIAYLDQQFDDMKRPEGPNPFAAPPAPPQTNIVYVPPVTTNPPPVKPLFQKPPAPRKPDIVNIIYRGYMQKPDGKVVAFIENSKLNSRSFYTISNKVHEITITGIAIQQVKGLLENGDEIVLKLNKPAVFEDGRYVRSDKD